jgi:hypothetical protein
LEHLHLLSRILDNRNTHALACNSPLFLAYLAVLSNFVGFFQAKRVDRPSAPAPCHI